MAATFADRVADEVRGRRASLRLSQQDLADMAGVSERFVRFVEQGKPSVQLDSLLAVLETLGLELRLGTRSRAAARALVSQPPTEISSDASLSDPPTDVPSSKVPSPDAASESSARP
ncbi:helix-turn-helix transcriptional regulator [Arthrobacter sp. ZGTC131]|uniref:helix-turn-helix transcriptional regulator n=1 Tax=Arthrobacter sp. ZGTC131 TaxID=2058898 RepID=UPI000CE35B09|nr:helix-turn-helix transcriptional regulator [Arthrobacter sp. ZGTC131]